MLFFRRFRGGASIKGRLFARGIVAMGIDTSCDDTCVAIVDHRRSVRASVCLSQTALNVQWGGVVPILASSEHERLLPHAVASCLESANMCWKDVDVIAVTQGPGLSPCLLKGMQYARSCARHHALPLLHVHHLEAHAVVARMFEDVLTPFLTLLVSGGHCQLLLAEEPNSVETVFEPQRAHRLPSTSSALQLHRSHLRWTCIGNTLDDSLGEALDKVARMLDIPLGSHLHGGAALEQAAIDGCDTTVPFSVPLSSSLCCNFSFSGLKSAVRRHVDQLKASNEQLPLTPQRRADIAASFQRVSFKHIAQRVDRGIRYSNQLLSQPITSLVVCGGVASNHKLRSSLDAVGQRHSLPVVYPPPAFCVDNGAMIAWLGIERIASLGLPAVAACDNRDECITRWPLGKQAAVSYK
jgi:N6-L-threonylcarbamoyladenine synthase